MRAGVEQLAGAVIEPVLAGRAAVTGLELSALVLEVGVVARYPIDDLALDPPCDAGEHVDEAVRVGRHEVDRRIPRVELVHRDRDGQPPAAGVAREAEVTATDQPERDAAFLALDRG